MRPAQFIDVIYTHTEGEPTGIIHGGILYPHGLDILGKRQFLMDHYDHLRTSIMREPRGHNDMFGVFLTPPSGPDADAGMLWMDGERFVEMCGHGTIALGMVMVTHGFVPRADGPITTIRLETPVGPVSVEVKCDAGGAEWTRFQNVPAFVLEQDIPITLPGIGETTADIVFGGNFFAVVRWPDKDRPIAPENGHLFSRLGVLVTEQINARMEVRHPTETHVHGLHFCTFWQEPDRPDSLYRNVHVFSGGKLDRSPGGTGTSMMMAYFEARGKIAVGQTIRSEGLLGSGQFEGCLVGETTIGDRRAVIPTVKGTAKVIGYAKWLLDPDDPVGRGFVVS
ncbi:MAG: proline racemase family protein [Hyphomicrobiales bacterium]|nr:proline racemase family protein [Hyphomicrobiales bacterium]